MDKPSGQDALLHVNLGQLLAENYSDRDNGVLSSNTLSEPVTE